MKNLNKRAYVTATSTVFIVTLKELLASSCYCAGTQYLELLFATISSCEILQLKVASLRVP